MDTFADLAALRATEAATRPLTSAERVEAADLRAVLAERAKAPDATVLRAAADEARAVAKAEAAELTAAEPAKEP